MIDTLRFLMSRQLKRSKLAKKTSGFTLIELLVAMILAVLVITPLLTFMNNIMDNDRREQAKATSEQEIQSALDYIAQDLEQAVYIYDADGLNYSSKGNPPGIQDQIPPLASAPGCDQNNTCVPVLVFWKRKFTQGVVPVTVNGNIVYNDAFVYSLVAYYLVQGNSVDGNWSKTARIGRFEIRDGVTDPTNPTNSSGNPNYIKTPSPGFKPFDLTIAGQGLKQKLDAWQNNGQPYTDKAFTLVDYIDQSTIAQNTKVNLIANCPAPKLVTANFVAGFYACVDSSTSSVQIYIRGNATARLPSIFTNSTYSDSRSIYFPTASIQIKGRGLLNSN